MIILSPLFKFHHISTDELYGDLNSPEDFFRETMLCASSSPYSASKASSDHLHLVRELGWKPQETFESGIRKTVLWYLEHRDDWCAHVLSGSYKMERLGTGE